MYKPKRDRIPRPFLKWAGGKTQLLPELLQSIEKYDGDYHEPFVGGGALFFEHKPRRAHLSDLNKELINCFLAVRDVVDEVIAKLKEHVYEKDYYYGMRALDPLKLEPAERAARTIYLNRSGFNGLYRVNSKGIFNVPFGRHKNPNLCDEANLRGCSEILKDVEIVRASFDAVLDNAKKGDFVYFDPPYIPISQTAYFTSYEKNGFGMDMQEALADVFDALATKGVHVMLSNADVPWIHTRYKEYDIRVVQAKRSVNSNKDKRGPVGEVIVKSFR